MTQRASLSEALTARSRLEELLEAYLYEAGRMRYPQLKRRQERPFATLAHGALGVAYAFWRAGELRKDRAHLERASRWLTAVERATSSDFLIPELLPSRPKRSWLWFGRGGIPFVGALIAAAQGRGVEAHLKTFLSLRHPRAGERAELLMGVAGYLSGTTFLFSRLKDLRLRSLGDRLAARLLDPTRPLTRDDRPGFAHGESGICYALLRWSLASGYPLPGTFLRSVRELAECSPEALSPTLPRSWCNGSAGLVLFLVAAYERTGEAFYLRQAQAAGRFTAEGGEEVGTLCCGLGGRAYALLVLARVDPGQGWEEQALELGAQAIEVLSGPWPNGLLRGYPGLVCLALDLLHPQGRGDFPSIG